MTAETANDHWVEITKAFKALTDEDIRNNYLQYGHPDGKQSFSIGIALPSFLVAEGNGKYVLLVYGTLLGVLLPYVVGKWWYGTQRVTKDKVLVATAGNLFREYDEDMTERDVVAALSSGEEYKDVLRADTADGSLERLRSALGVDTSTLNVKDQECLDGLGGVRQKALALLWGYLNRVDFGDQAFNTGKCSRLIRREISNRSRREIRNCTHCSGFKRIPHQYCARLWQHPTSHIRFSHGSKPHPSYGS